MNQQQNPTDAEQFAQEYFGLSAEDEDLVETVATIADHFALRFESEVDYAIEVIDDDAVVKMTNIHQVRDLLAEDMVQAYKELQIEEYGYEGDYFDDFAVVVKQKEPQ